MSDTYNIDLTRYELDLIINALEDYDEGQPADIYGVNIPTLISKLNISAPKYTISLPSIPSTTCPMATSYTSSIPSVRFTARQGYLYEGKFYEDENHIIPIYAKDNEIYIDLANSNKLYAYIESEFIPIGI